MKHIWLPNKIINKRPLVFLCGPFCDEKDKKDRRYVLRQHIGGIKLQVRYNGRSYEIEPFPLIVDNLFDKKVLDTQVNISLVEEIIAACAYRNYIFLDTMSASLELGLFSNSYSKNKNIALLPNDYKYFSPSIGEFVTKAIDNSNNISCVHYNNKRYNKFVNNVDDKNKSSKIVLKNIIGFKYNQVPLEIKNQIKKDFIEDIETYSFNMSFTDKASEKDKMYYRLKDDRFSITVPSNILFYLVNEYNNLEKIKDVVLSYFKQNVCNKEIQFANIIYKIDKELIKYEIRTEFAYSTVEVVNNINYLITAIKNKASGAQRYQNLEYRRTDYNGIDVSFYDFLGVTEKEVHRFHVDKHLVKKAITCKKICINGKNRKIDMYKNNSEGYALRVEHDKIKDIFESLIEFNDNTYAYIKNKSAKECVMQHIDSKYFLKLDICEFFGSIKKRLLKKIIRMHFCKDCVEQYDEIMLGEKYCYDSEYIDTWDGLDEVLNICFVKGRLPLGLVTSPVLSNIYMSFLDSRVRQRFPELIYTRYSDDILISSPSEFDAEEIKSFIVKELSYLKLNINNKKTKKLVLKDPGDHVKFLGLNVVKGEESNYITVGKNYIRSLAHEISKYNHDGTLGLNENEELIGKMNYIRYVNEDDYKYLKKFYKIKTGEEFYIKKLMRTCFIYNREDE